MVKVIELHWIALTRSDWKAFSPKDAIPARFAYNIKCTKQVICRRRKVSSPSMAVSQRVNGQKKKQMKSILYPKYGEATWFSCRVVKNLTSILTKHTVHGMRERPAVHNRRGERRYRTQATLGSVSSGENASRSDVIRLSSSPPYFRASRTHWTSWRVIGT